MPEEFDPAWEYYEPDPYVAWVFATSGGVSGFDGLVDNDNPVRSMGLRFGTGNPNHGAYFKEARERPSARREREEPKLETKVCPQCGVPFLPARPARVYCSPRCAQLSLVKDRPLTRCGNCGAEFKPWRPHQVMCSPRCGSLHAGAVSARVRPNKLGGLERFREMYERGVKVTDAARELGISPVTAKKWRRRLGLAPRGPRGKVVNNGG